MKKYAIFYYKNELNKGISKMFLTDMGNFGHTTNLTFNSVDHAMYFIKTHNITGPICKLLLIQGPRGGVYSAYTGRIIK